MDRATRSPRRAHAQRRAAAVAVLMVVGALASCSGRDGADPPATTVDRAAITDPARQADVSGLVVRPTPAGAGVAQRSATVAGARVPLPTNYTETEYLVEGEANVYSGPATGPAVVESSDHPYVTRMLVRTPTDPATASGRVWIEPFNTSGGGELDAVWASVGPLMVQEGDAWIGVTVRAKQTEALQTFDPVRYADVALTDNDYGWDVLRDVGTLVKLNIEPSPLSGWPVDHVYLAGYSQSAGDAATFAGAFNPITRLGDGAAVYDGYLLGAHESTLAPLQSGDSIIPSFEAAPIPAVDVPVVGIEPQTDVEGFSVDVPIQLARDAGLEGAAEAQGDTIPYVSAGGASVRRPNADDPTDKYSLLEIAGAPHGTGGGNGCDGFTSFPTSIFTRGAAAFLVKWTEQGIAPPDSDRIDLAVDAPVSVSATDVYGNAVGGVRSPFVDVPLSTYAVHSGPGPTCLQVGNETPLPTSAVVQKYGDATRYMAEFTTSLDATIDAGYLLDLDRQAILDATRQKAAERFGGS